MTQPHNVPWIQELPTNTRTLFSEMKTTSAQSLNALFAGFLPQASCQPLKSIEMGRNRGTSVNYVAMPSAMDLLADKPPRKYSL